MHKKKIFIHFLLIMFWMLPHTMHSHVNLLAKDFSLTPEKYKKTHIFYKLEKNRKFCGYLIGTIHADIGYTGYKKKKVEFEPYIKQVKKVYFEIEQNYSYKFLKFGCERSLYKILEQYPEIKRSSFETRDFQDAMTASLYWWGATLMLPHWHSHEYLQENPEIINSWSYSFLVWKAWLRNRFYKHDEHLQGVRADIIQKLKLLRRLQKNYFEREIIEELSPFDTQWLLLAERNKAWIEKLKRKNDSEPIAIICGAAHLPGREGMVALLEKEGFVLTPILFNR